MSKRVYPPPRFQCPYRDACPHLGSLSTTWVLGEYRRGEKRYQEHLRIIDNFHEELQRRNDRIRILERENAEVKAKLKMLHQQQFKANTKKSTAEKKADSPVDGCKKRGAPVGHPAWTRPRPTRIDRTIHVPAPTECPHCQKTNLILSPETHQHLQEDIVIIPKTVVTNYVHSQAFCAHCNRLVVKAAKQEFSIPAVYGGNYKVQHRIKADCRKQPGNRLCNRYFFLYRTAAYSNSFSKRQVCCRGLGLSRLYRRFRPSADCLYVG